LRGRIIEGDGLAFLGGALAMAEGRASNANRVNRASVEARAADPAIGPVDALRRLCAQHESVDALLEDAAQIALEVLGAEVCAMIWLDEDRRTPRVRAWRRRDAQALSADDDARIVRFIAALHTPPQGPKARAAPGTERARALHIGTRTVGYLYARAEGKRGARAPGLDTVLLDALAAQLGMAIETLHLRQLLASRYATIALSRNGQGDGADAGALDVSFLSAVTHPEKVARIIARSFYKDLRKAGFETKQILVVATELIDSLNVALRRTKAKTTQAEAGAPVEAPVRGR
jgi:hypothetical protein